MLLKDVLKKTDADFSIYKGVILSPVGAHESLKVWDPHKTYSKRYGQFVFQGPRGQAVWGALAKKRTQNMLFKVILKSTNLDFSLKRGILSLMGADESLKVWDPHKNIPRDMANSYFKAPGGRQCGGR